MRDDAMGGNFSMTFDEISRSQLTRIQAIPPRLTKQIAAEVLNATFARAEKYRDYHPAGWCSATVMNPTGDLNDNVIADGRARATPLLKSLPLLAKFLDRLKLQVQWARLAEMHPGVHLPEHVDYCDLAAIPRVRLHLPIVTNPGCYMTFADRRVDLPVGYVYKFIPTSPHGACNIGQSCRLHLIIDVYADDVLRSLIDNESPCDNIEPLPRLDEVSKQTIFERARQLLNKGRLEDVDQLILQQFSFFDLRESSYDLLLEFCSREGLVEHADLWEQRRLQHMGHNR